LLVLLPLKAACLLEILGFALFHKLLLIAPSPARASSSFPGLYCNAYQKVLGPVLSSLPTSHVPHLVLVSLLLTLVGVVFLLLPTKEHLVDRSVPFLYLVTI
jgi:hypothetical protein